MHVDERLLVKINPENAHASGGAVQNVMPLMSSSKLRGVVTLVQERRFQLVDERGVCHRFLLDAAAPVDPRALHDLVRSGEAATVWFRGNESHLLAHVATDIAVCDEHTGGPTR